MTTPSLTSEEYRLQLHNTVYRDTRGVVQRGPFKGLKLCPRFSWGDGDVTAKLLGFYEQELHLWLHSVVRAEPPPACILNVGCAEGYYAVGLARLCPDARVTAFDGDESARKLCTENAELNGVHIDVCGACTNAELDRVIIPGKTFILSDCEGAEESLFDPERCPALRECSFLIELHSSHGAALLQDRFRHSHDLFLIDEGGRDPNIDPFLRKLPSLERWLAVCENRPFFMQWLYGEPGCVRR